MIAATGGAAASPQSDGVPLLIQGGFSRYAKYGTPGRPDWRYLGLAFVMLGVGSSFVCIGGDP